MWSFHCAGTTHESHTYELVLESLLLHRGAMNLTLEANGVAPVVPCRLNHDLVYSSKPCSHVQRNGRACSLPTDTLVKPTEEQVLQIMALNCRLVRMD